MQCFNKRVMPCLIRSSLLSLLLLPLRASGVLATNTADAIREMGGEWVAVGFAGTPRPEIGRLVVQNHVCGLLTVYCTTYNDVNGKARSDGIGVISYAGNRVLLNRISQPSVQLDGKYLPEQNSLLWYDASIPILRWRFDGTREHFTKEEWNRETRDWGPVGYGTVYCRPGAQESLTSVVHRMVVGGVRDSKGCVVATSTNSTSTVLNARWRFEITHVPPAPEYPTVDITARPSSMDVVVTNAVVVYKGVFSENRFPMGSADGRNFLVRVPYEAVAGSDAYAILMQAADGGVGCTPWYHLPPP